MDTPLDEISPGPGVLPPGDPAILMEQASVSGEQEATAEAPFDPALAVRYSVANLGSQAVYALFNFGMPLYLQTYGLPPPLIGLLANERSFVGAFVQPIVGRLSDRTRTRLGRRRPFFLVGIPLMAASLLLLAVHPPFWVMLGLMTVGAFFLFIASDPWQALMADLFPPDQRGRLGGYVGVTTALGFMVFNVIAALLWKDAEPLVFALTIAVLVAAWAFTFFTVKEPPMPALTAPVVTTRTARPDPLAYIRGILEYPEAAKYMLAVSLFWVGSGGAAPFITLFGKNVLGADESQVFLLPLAYLGCQVLCALPAGYLADRIGKKRMLTAGLALFGLTALVGSQSQDLLQGTIALSVIGVAQAGLTVLVPQLTDLIPTRRTAEFVGLGSAIWSFAQPLGSVLAGSLVAIMIGVVGDHDSYRWAFIFAGVLGLGAMFLLQWVRPERARQD